MNIYVNLFFSATSKAFEVRFRTNQNEAEDDADTGFCVNYNQQPCNR